MFPRMSDPRSTREKHKNGSENVGSHGAREISTEMAPRITDPKELEREVQKWLRECRIPRSYRERSTKMAPRMSDPGELKREKHKKCLRESRIPRS